MSSRLLMRVSLHYPMTGKDCACLGIERCRSQPCVDCGVLDIGMSQPILYKRQISASIKQVCGNGMLQAMEFPFLPRQPRQLAVRLHEIVQPIAAYRYRAIRQKERG